MLKVQLRRFTRKLRVDPWPALEWFFVLLNDSTNSQEHVNDACKQLFTQNCRTIDALPPTRVALIQHAKRTAFQAGYCWGQMMIPAPELLSPSEWGWVQRDSGCWEIYCTTLPEATLGCGNSSDAVARKVAEGSANVSRQHSSARLWATASDIVRMIRTPDNSCSSLNENTLH